MRLLERDSNRVLIAVAHPDDEVLGAGATAAKLTDAGVAATACILSGRANARTHRPSDADLLTDIGAAADRLGMERPIVGDFPNIAMNTVDHIKLVQFIEAAILETGSNVIFTHHPSDLNDDHRQVSSACQVAARIAQRRAGLPPLRSLYFMEVLSSTDWGFPGASGPFLPTAFMEVGKHYMERKLDALACYRNVMRPLPHPRSREVVRSLATYRGGQSGMIYAEAFQTVMSNLSHLGGDNVIQTEG